MTEPLQVGQFAIVDHEPVDRGPNAGVFTGKGPPDDRAELFIVAEGTTPAGEAFAGHVISAAGQAWTSLDMSLTGSLQRVFAEADRNVADWNHRSIAHHHVQLGMVCFARRGAQALVAQAGPSVVFHLSGDELSIYTPDDEHALPLGGGASEPQLRRVNILPGDRLLLISTGALREMDDEMLGGILTLRRDQILPEIYRRVDALRHVTVLLITSGEARSALPQLPEPAFVEPVIGGGEQAAGRTTEADPDESRDIDAAGSFQPSLFIDDEHESVVEDARRRLVEISVRARNAVAIPAEAPEIPQPLRRAVGDNSLARLAAERQASAALAQAAIQAQAAVVMPGRSAWRGHAATNGTSGEHPAGDVRRRRSRQSFSRGLVREDASPLPEHASDGVPLATDLADEARARAAALGPISPVSDTIAGDNAAAINGGGSLVRVRSNMSGRWKGGSGLGRRRAIPGGQLPPTWLVIIVGLGVLLTLVGIVTVPGMLDRKDSERYANLIDQAQQKIATAGALQGDPTQRRKSLTEAQALLLEARDFDSDAPEAGQLLATVAQSIAGMDNIKAPASVEELGSLEQFGEKPVAITRMAIASDAAYLLDNASGQVISMSLAKDERKVVFSEDKDAKRGRPQALAFLEGTDLGGPTLLVADSSRALWSFSPASGLRQLPFAAAANTNITDIAVFGRDLYVLDANAAQVWRFSPADGGFAAAPTKVLDTPDLAAARRLMVDQEIVTTDANGQVRRFTGQVSLVLSEGGIDRRLAAPELPQSLGKSGDLAVLDAPNDRIVVLKRDGAFDRQYRSADFKASSSMAARNGVIYLFSGGKLRRVTL